MLQQPVHMRDQISNRIEIIMQENKPSLLFKVEELSLAVLFILVFVLGLNV
ncbi:MAG: hypothetical protein HOP23_16810 [Methylococcaceae bacterium]|nr:hypothetical protein [Methylococcaceae bacterium]